MTSRDFTRKRVQSLTLGEKLQQLREDRRMRIQDLSRKINIKVQYIDALEKGDYDRLPTKVYAKGFVRSYARFFGVPEDVLLNLFEREYSIYRNISHRDVEENVSRLPKVPRFVLTPRVIFIFFSSIVLGAVGVYLYFGVDSFVSSPWLIVEQPIDNSVINGDTAVVEGRTRSSAQVTVNGQQIFVDIDGNFSDKIDLSPGINTINIKSTNKFNKETEQQITVDAQYEIAQEEDVVTKNIQIFLRAQDVPVWVNVVADGIDVYNDTIQIDEEREFNAAEQISITTSSGANTLISSDGTDYEPLSDEVGVVKEWTYERNSSDEVTDDVDQSDEEASL